jgi:hypothetical protein
MRLATVKNERRSITHKSPSFYNAGDRRIPTLLFVSLLDKRKYAVRYSSRDDILKVATKKKEVRSRGVPEKRSLKRLPPSTLPREILPI